MRLFLILLLAVAVHLSAEALPAQSPQEEAIARQRQALTRMGPAIAQQQSSLRKQAHAAPASPDAFFVLEPPTRLSEDPQADCPALSELELDPLISGAAARYSVPADLLRAVARQESAFHPCAISSKGALGLMQLMPETAGELGVSDPFDPQQNMNGGASYLKQLLERYSGDLNRTLGAYNAGPARVDAAQGVPAIPETLNYVSRIIGSLQLK